MASPFLPRAEATSTTFSEQPASSRAPAPDSDDDDEFGGGLDDPLYDQELDERDARWLEREQRRANPPADAQGPALNCPCCFTTLVLPSMAQPHECYANQWRAIFVRNIAGAPALLEEPDADSAGAKKREPPVVESADTLRPPPPGFLRPVSCAVCTSEVGVLDPDDIYHLFNVIPSG